MASSISFSDQSSSQPTLVYPVGAAFTYDEILIIDSRYWAVHNAVQREIKKNPTNLKGLLNNPLDNYLFWLPPSLPFLSGPVFPDESIDLSINRNDGSTNTTKTLQFYLTVKPVPLDDADANQEDKNPEAMTIADLRERPDHTIMRNLQPFCRVCKLTQGTPSQLITHVCGCNERSLQHIHKECLLALIHEDSFYIPGISTPDTSLPRKNLKCPLCEHYYTYTEPAKKITCCQRVLLVFLSLYSVLLTLLLISEIYDPFSFSLNLGLSTTFLVIYSGLSYLLLFTAIIKASNCKRVLKKNRVRRQDTIPKTERTPSSSSLMEAMKSPVKASLSERIRQRKQMFKVSRVKVLPYH